MKHTRMLFILLAVLALAIPTFAQDDEDLLLINILEDGDEVEDALTEDVMMFLYGFNGLEGDEVTISMDAQSDELDPYLVLLGPAGELIAFDDDSGGSLDALIEDAELPYTGTYFIIASSISFMGGFDYFFDEDELEFELTIDGIGKADEDDEANFLYYSGDLFDGETIQGYSNEDEVVFYWTFFGEEGDEVSIELESNDFDTLLYLFAPGGIRIAGNDDANGTDSEIENIELPEDGRYLVFATGFGFTSALNGDYEGGDFDISLDIDN
ncbi:MAG: PPC domain-containing protein [Chloroflexota bacterium]